MTGVYVAIVVLRHVVNANRLRKIFNPLIKGLKMEHSTKIESIKNYNKNKYYMKIFNLKYVN